MHLRVLDPVYREWPLPWHYFFDINGNDYTYTTNPECTDPVEILITNHMVYTDSLVTLSDAERRYRYGMALYMDVQHTRENILVDQLRDSKWAPPRHYKVTSGYDPCIENNPYFIFNDHYFNLTKAYYLGYHWRPDALSTRFYYTTPADYVVPQWHGEQRQSRIFLAPCYNLGTSRPYRHRLAVHLRDHHLKHGHLGASDLDPALALYAQSQLPQANALQDLLYPDRAYQHRGNAPPHHAYYTDTFVSFYTECVEWGSTVAISEKTFRPLIMGHFILPFSCPGIIDRLKRFYGFRFPDFIDYGYDEEANNDRRFGLYLAEIDRLMSLQNWHNLWNDNRDIIFHNQKIFESRPYDRVDFTRYLA